MRYETLAEMLAAASTWPKGPVAVMLCENAFLQKETSDWLLKAGFAVVAAIGAPVRDLAPDDAPIRAASAPISTPEQRADAVNQILRVISGRWCALVFNGEFLFYPQIERRGVADFTDFLTAERRRSAMGYAIDLYSDALGAEEDAFTLDEVYFDAAGWYGFEREGEQVDVYGGLGWRFEEYTPRDMFRINRPALVRCDQGVSLRGDMWLDEEEANTVACPWHHNPTVALMSVRRARALRTHPKFGGGVISFMWPKSERFNWTSEQLLSLGLIEQGQWL